MGTWVAKAVTFWATHFSSSGFWQSDTWWVGSMRGRGRGMSGGGGYMNNTKCAYDHSEQKNDDLQADIVCGRVHTLCILCRCQDRFTYKRNTDTSTIIYLSIRHTPPKRNSDASWHYPNHNPIYNYIYIWHCHNHI